MEKVNKPTHIIGLILVVLGFSVILGPFLLNDFWPRYIVLDPPMPERARAIGEHKTVYITYNAGEATNKKLWVWKKEYDFTPSVENLNTAETILDYFDKWLEDQGWEKFEEQGFPCGGMIEADFLERGENLFVYVPKDTKYSYSAPAVCVAVWPYTTADNYVGHFVLLFSERP